MIKEHDRLRSTRLKNEFSEAIENVDINVLRHYIETGKSGFPPDLVVYMELIEMVRALYSKYETKGFILKVLMGEPYNINRHRANRLYYDSLSFFNSDNQVKQKEWENIYAEHLDKLAYYAWEKDDVETARRCFLDAAKFRGVGQLEKSELPKEMFARPVIVYSIDPEKVGIEKASRKQLGDFIDNLPDISERDRTRIKKDAGVIDPTIFTDFTNDAKSNKTDNRPE